jgi:hypothetical protein
LTGQGGEEVDVVERYRRERCTVDLDELEP